jgi:transposase
MLNDAQWTRLEKYWPGRRGDPGRPGADNRRFVEAVLWIGRAGVAWRDLPEEFGPWNSVYRRFARWRDAGVWERAFSELSRSASRPLRASIDSTIVRAHQHAAGARKGGRQAKRSDAPGAG